MMFNVGHSSVSFPLETPNHPPRRFHGSRYHSRYTSRKALTLVIPQRQRTAINLEHHCTAHSILDRKIITAKRHLLLPDTKGNLSSMLSVVRDH